MARCISSRRCVSAYPQPCRFSLGSWLLFLPSYTRWVSACGATSTTGSSSPPLGSLSSTISRLSWISVGSWVLWSTPRNPTSFPLRWFSISGWSSMPSLLWLLRRRIASPGLYQPPENFCPPTRLPQLFGSLCWGCFPPWLTSSLEGDFARGLFSFAFIGLGIRWTSRLLWLGPWTAFRICGGGSTCLGCLRGCPSVRCLPTWTFGPTPRTSGGVLIWALLLLPASGTSCSFVSLSTPGSSLPSVGVSSTFSHLFWAR